MKKSILAGIFIGIGAITNLMFTEKIIGALMFSLGLILVLIFEAHLYTGKIGYLIDKITIKEILYLIQILLGNCIGIYIMRLYALKFLPIIANKLNNIQAMPNLYYLILSIPCGMLMYLAVEGYKKTKSFLIPMLCVATFIMCGFQHCIVVGFNFGILNLKFLYAVIGNTIGGITFRWLTTSFKDHKPIY